MNSAATEILITNAAWWANHFNIDYTREVRTQIERERGWRDRWLVHIWYADGSSIGKMIFNSESSASAFAAEVRKEN